MTPAVEEKKKRRRPIHDLALAATKQVWMAPAVEEKKKQERQIPILAPAAIEQVWMVLAMGNPNPHMRDTRRQMKVPILSHQKFDATYTCFGFWLKEERLLSHPIKGKKYLWPLSSLP